MFRRNTMNSKLIALTLVVMAILAMVALPASAQGNAPENTITVVGSGTAYAEPDIANIEVGVEFFDRDVTTAFAQTNERISAIITALTEAGVAREDIQTANLSVYSNRRFSEETGREENVFEVRNTVRIVVRDIANVESVIDAAINAGANNLYALNFTIENPDALEQDARVMAMEDAEARATALAELVGVELGEVTIINESGGFGFGMPYFETAGRGLGGGGGGAVVEPGQTAVTMQVQVTYRIAR